MQERPQGRRRPVEHTAAGRSVADLVEFTDGLGPDVDDGSAVGDVPGYDPSAARYEVAASGPAAPGAVAGLSYLAVPVRVASLGSALRRIGATSRTVGRSEVFDTGGLPLLLKSESYALRLIGIDHVAVPADASAVVVGGGVPVSDVVELADRSHVTRSLGSDPVLREFVGLWPDALSTVMGTSLVVQESQILGGKITPAAAREIGTKAGIGRIPLLATAAAWSYLGGSPSSPTVGAAAYCGSHAAAEAAVRTVGAYLRTGESYSRHLPYSDILQVQSLAAKGNLLVARLHVRMVGAFASLLADDDFPLFWTPSE